MAEKNYNSISCNLCGADDYLVVYEAKYDQEKDEDLAVKFRSSGDETLVDQVVKCNRCGLSYINPVLDSSIVLEGYSEGKDETFVSQNDAREKTFTKCLKVIEEYYPKRGRILDIGTAGGSFLHVCKGYGWEVAGCEPNKWLCQWAKDNYKIDVLPGTVFEQPYQEASFDVVTLWDVLEHTPDPRKVLEECMRLLKDDGLLIINFPDVGSWIAKMMKRKWVFLLSVHLYYFDKKTISQMLSAVGFEIVKIKPHYQFLEIGYIFKRAEAYVGKVASFSQRMVNFFGLGKIMIPYWLGQTLVVARKKGNNR